MSPEHKEQKLPEARIYIEKDNVFPQKIRERLEKLGYVVVIIPASDVYAAYYVEMNGIYFRNVDGFLGYLKRKEQTAVRELGETQGAG